MLNLNHGSGAKLAPSTISDKVNDAIDAGIMRRRAAEPQRNYLGASSLGDPCKRKLCYSYSKTPVDPDREITAKQARIFALGHELEDFAADQFAHVSGLDNVYRNLAARWFVDAGFVLRTTNAKGNQFGFETLGGKIRGHIDGAFVSTPVPEIICPCGWEHKGLNTKSWSKVKKNGVKFANEIYYGQMQTYMGYMHLDRFLFTATNKNTSEMHHELVDFDPARAQILSDRGLEVIQAVENGELLAREFNNPDFYLCKFCDWRQRCWK